MKVNYIQVAYVLGCDNNEAKLKIYPYTNEFDSNKSINEQYFEAKRIRSDVYVESGLLGLKFRHPSDLINNKDIIEYTIMSIRKNPTPVFKKVLNYVPVLRKGKLTGIYKALRYILTEEQVKDLSDKIRERHEVFKRCN